MRRLIAAATLAAMAAAPASAKEWSNDKAWTVTEFNDGACLLRYSKASGPGFQVIETPDGHASLSVVGLPGITAKPAPLRYGFTDQAYMTVLVERAKVYMTERDTSIDTVLWTLGAHPASLLGKPALESEVSRNFIDLLGSYQNLMLSTEDKPMLEGYFDVKGAPAAIAALRRCTAAISARQPKGSN